jgi:hypothetical protein
MQVTSMPILCNALRGDVRRGLRIAATPVAPIGPA